MTIDQPVARGPGISERAAILSIIGFWSFYFAIVTLRWAVLGYENQLDMLGRRVIVSIASMAITWLIYRVLRAISNAPLRTGILAAGLLAIPAAIAYSSINHYAFLTVETDLAASKVIVSNDGDDRNVTVQVGAMPDEHEKTPLMAIADQAANGFFFFVAWAALYLALSYAAQVRSAERQAAAYRAAARDAELRALRYQVNPHFLFNTLNSLSGLVMTDRPEAAERMIMNLSTFFRTSLSGDPTEDVTLEQEIHLQKLYLEIEAVRFPDRLKVDIAIPPELENACVPGLILQPLVENAIKYGVARARRPVRVAIRARADGDRLVLAVEDDGEDAETEGGSGIGLKNVADRIQARFGSDGSAIWGPRPGGGFVVVLKMPLVRNGC
ncbi:histidine kinase [Sphingomonas sp. 1P06PA]|uniref:sensor histidine kinase n=1 Tax=Sphingomonas sp. 1P06PA TaxID=554121 RepID=UPI0039A56083